MTAFTDMLEALFSDDNFAHDAVWTPLYGLATAIRVVPNRDDEISSFGATRIQSDKAVFDVRRSEAPTMAAGGALSFDGTGYTIKHVRRDDPERLIWTIECFES